MRKRTNHILMLAYILFIFISVLTKRFYAQSKWIYIVTAITTTSWILVLSDAFAAMASFLNEYTSTVGPEFESCDAQVRRIQTMGIGLDLEIKDKYGNKTGETMGQYLAEMEKSAMRGLKTVKKEEKKKKVYFALSEVFALAGFIVFFCVFIFDPVFSFFSSCVEEMAVLAFGIILLVQLSINIMKDTLLDLKKSLKTYNDYQEICNHLIDVEANTHAG